jgi:hypothetical protein
MILCYGNLLRDSAVLLVFPARAKNGRDWFVDHESWIVHKSGIYCMYGSIYNDDSIFIIWYSTYSEEKTKINQISLDNIFSTINTFLRFSDQRN